MAPDADDIFELAYAKAVVMGLPHNVGIIGAFIFSQREGRSAAVRCEDGQVHFFPTPLAYFQSRLESGLCATEVKLFEQLQDRGLLTRKIGSDGRTVWNPTDAGQRNGLAANRGSGPHIACDLAGMSYLEFQALARPERQAERDNKGKKDNKGKIDS